MSRPLAAGAALYECRVFHARRTPLRNAFRYRTYQWLVDLDELPRPHGPLRLLAGFEARDHLGDPDRPIRANVDEFLRQRGVDLGGGRVLMLAHARVFGYVFNPLTVFWCHHPDGTLACVIAEVHNTYRQRHAYLVQTDERGRARAGQGALRLPVPPGRRLVPDEPAGAGGAACARHHPAPARPLPLHRQRAGQATGGHRPGAAARGRPASVVHPGGRRPDQVPGPQVVRARPAAGAATARQRTERRSVTSTKGAATRETGRTGTPGVIDPGRWPDVAVVRGQAARGRVARLLFRAAVARLPVRVLLPGGHWLGAGSRGAPVMTVHDPDAFFTRLGSGGLIGFGESYLAGEWDCADLTGLLTVFASHVRDLVPAPLQRLRALAVRRQPGADDQNRVGARRNISHHYDLSNEFFALFLDETMTYSAALFETAGTGPAVAPGQPARNAAAGGLPAGGLPAGGLPAGGLPAGSLPAGSVAAPAAPALALTPAHLGRLGAGARGTAGEVLARAQRRKIDRLLDEAKVGPGRRVLEIGTGWGELAIRAAQRGATVRTVTISARQRELAARRVAEHGLASQVSVELRDYRDVDGEYDAICSVEMLEAVGERYWDTYFAQLDRLLAPGGAVGLQAITMPHDAMLASRRTYTWIQKYIFPGGLIPSVTAIEDSLARTGLRVTRRYDFGSGYAQTLRLWRDRFAARQHEVTALGFDEIFLRMWQFYLCYSEAGFRAGYLDVSQFTLERP